MPPTAPWEPRAAIRPAAPASPGSGVVRAPYTGNASGSISGFRVGTDGGLTALDADGRTAVLALSPRDLDASRNGRFLYAVSPGNAAAGAGRVTAFKVAVDGSLREVDSVPAAIGITGAAAA